MPGLSSPRNELEPGRFPQFNGIVPLSAESDNGAARVLSSLVTNAGAGNVRSF